MACRGESCTQASARLDHNHAQLQTTVQLRNCKQRHIHQPSARIQTVRTSRWPCVDYEAWKRRQQENTVTSFKKAHAQQIHTKDRLIMDFSRNCSEQRPQQPSLTCHITLKRYFWNAPFKHMPIPSDPCLWCFIFYRRTILELLVALMWPAMWAHSQATAAARLAVAGRLHRVAKRPWRSGNAQIRSSRLWLTGIAWWWWGRTVYTFTNWSHTYRRRPCCARWQKSAAHVSLR